MFRTFRLMIAPAIVIASLLGASMAQATGSYDSKPSTKVTICHATNSATNPYVRITVSANAADGIAGNSGQQADHFGEHTGPVFDSKVHDQSTRGWGDIIPPVGFAHNGLNWTAEGQAIWNNDCKPVVPSPPVEPNCVQGDCQLTPAVPITTVVSPEQTVTTSSTTYTYDEVRELIATYERRTSTIIAVNFVPRGVKSSKGCVDPVKKGWIKVGEAFRNTRANGSPFWDRWERGWRICGAKRVKIGKLFYMKGTKQNCANKDILIPLGKAKKVKRVIKRSIEVRTWTEAVRISVTSSTTTTTTIIPAVTVTEYACLNGGELVTVDGVAMCKVCPPPVCTCPKGYVFDSKSNRCMPKDDHPVAKKPCPKNGHDHKHDNKSYNTHYV